MVRFGFPGMNVPDISGQLVVFAHSETHTRSMSSIAVSVRVQLLFCSTVHVLRIHEMDSLVVSHVGGWSQPTMLKSRLTMRPRSVHLCYSFHLVFNASLEIL